MAGDCLLSIFSLIVLDQMGRGRIAGILSRVKCKHVHSACADLEPVDLGHVAVSVENTCIEFTIGTSPEHTDETGTK